MDPNCYIGRQGEFYDPPNRFGCFVNMRMLPFIIGMPWNEISLAAVSALRPSKIRVIVVGGEETTDSCPWRVTVYLDEARKIRDVHQEVTVQGFDGNGAQFDAQLTESPRWTTRCCGAKWNRCDISDHPGVGRCSACGSLACR